MIFHYLQGCFGSRRGDASVKAYFEKKQIPVSIGYYKAEGRWIRYLETGTPDKPLVLWVHGAPGAASAFLHFLSDKDLLATAHMISVDRPGFGYSSFGDTVVSLERQAAMLYPLLKKNQSEKLPVLAGHSYGGTIVGRMAMDFPDEIGALVMVAPAVDPRIEKIFRVSYPADCWMFRPLVPTCLRVTNEEKLGHVSQLYRMLPLWKKIVAAVTIIHGEKDKIAPVENVSFLQSSLTHARVKTIVNPHGGHLLPWETPQVMKEAVMSYL